MRFVSLLIMLLLTLVLAWFAAQNWTPVTLSLWTPYQLVIRLPVLMVVCVLAGWLPTTLVHSLQRWQLKRRLLRTEQALASHTRTAPEAPFEMPVLKSRTTSTPSAGFVPPVIPTPTTDDL